MDPISLDFRKKIHAASQAGIILTCGRPPEDATPASNTSSYTLQVRDGWLVEVMRPPGMSLSDVSRQSSCLFLGSFLCRNKRPRLSGISAPAFASLPSNRGPSFAAVSIGLVFIPTSYTDSGDEWGLTCGGFGFITRVLLVLGSYLSVV